MVEIKLITGRSHQIRAHMASIGHPIIGDVKYANRKSNRSNHSLKMEYGLSTQLLHCSRVVFHDAIKPLSYMNGKTIKAELPENFEKIINGLRSRKNE